MKRALDSDITLFDDLLFFYFRNKYKPEIKNYLKEKHYFEIENDISFTQKKINTFIWNGILVKEIVQLGYTTEHIANHYDSFFSKIESCKTIETLQNLEIDMFSKYIDILINQQEMTDHLLVNKILHFLYLHIEDYVSLKKVIDSVGISQSYGSKIFKEHMGTTIMDYQKSLKIERAKSLLKTGMTITEIGERLGFYDQAHFSKVFKKYAKMSPKDYQLSDEHFHAQN